jgi:colanic acid/amylovoran biosynthesis glycosyltransferase
MAQSYGLDRSMNSAPRRQRATLIHLHFGPDGMLIAPSARRLDVPLVLTCHGFDVMTDDHKSKDKLAQRWVKQRAKVFEQASLAIGGSDFVCDRLSSLGVPDSKLRRHYIGVDLSLFAEPSPASDRSGVLFVGRLLPHKGITDVIRAMSMNETTAATELMVIGDGPLRATCEAMAREPGVAARFLGRQGPAPARSWMQRSAVLCRPSEKAAAGGREALGLVVVEAQGCGTPVVGYRSGGVAEAVRDSVSALLVEEGDVPALSEALRLVLSDEVTRLNMGSEGCR